MSLAIQALAQSLCSPSSGRARQRGIVLTLAANDNLQAASGVERFWTTTVSDDLWRVLR